MIPMIASIGDTAIASVLTAAIAGLVAWLTARSARKGQETSAAKAAEAAVANQTLSSRTDIEKEAFERAKGYYTDAMDRQAAEITSMEITEQDLRARIVVLEDQAKSDRLKIQGLEDDVRHLQMDHAQESQRVADLQERLGVATQLLEQKYPNE